MHYYKNNKSSVIRDLLGILFLLGLGIGGQTFLLNPVEILTPNLPMLSRELLPNSASTFVHESSKSGLISEQREFEITIIIGEKDQVYRGDGWLSNKGAKILQKVFWYANPTEAVLAWEQSEKDGRDDFSNVPPIVANSLNENNPASSLYCSDEPNNRRICVYFSYWKHWYTEIWFWSGGDEYLSLSDIKRLSAKATELIMSAPDKP